MIENEYRNYDSYQIRIEGLKVMERHLGLEGMIRFLQQFETGRGDYTKERHKWLKEMSVEILAEKLLNSVQETGTRLLLKCLGSKFHGLRLKVNCESDNLDSYHFLSIFSPNSS